MFKPAVAFVMLGMGDAVKGTAIRDFEIGLKAIVSEIRKAGAIPVLQTGVYPAAAAFEAKICPYVEAIRRVSVEDETVLADHFAMWQKSPGLHELLGPGGVLPNELGHLQLAKELMALFDIGGSGFTWSLTGFGDAGKPVEKRFDCKESDPDMVSVELASLLRRSEPVTWLFSGDSITHGALHTRGCKSFAELFGERIRGGAAAGNPARSKDLVLNTGVSGATTRDLMANFDRWVAMYQPDAVFIAFGMNDCAGGIVPLGDFEANLRTAVSKVRSLGAIPILQTINTINPGDKGRCESLPIYVDAIRKVAREEQVHLVDHYACWTEAEKHDRNIKSRWLNDNIHPNELGASRMYDAICAALGVHGCR